MNAGVVIVGAGQAGAQLAMSLRELGFRGSVTLIGDEADVPYHRPPLSKDYMAGELAPADLLIRSSEFYRDEGIDLVTGARVASISRDAREVILTSGRRIPYAHLVLATGARNRTLDLGGAPAGNVFSLRTLEDADRLRDSLPGAESVLIVGAGFIGLEFASVARSAGAAVTVVEMADQVMGRAVSAETARYFAARHAAWGTDVLCGAAVEEFRRDEAGRVTGARIGGETRAVDLVLVGIGVIPNAELAEAAGLATDNGIVVDAQLRTSDPAISAIGDCARHPRPESDALVRVESVQNAADHARFLARRILGEAAEYDDVPWFWSHQTGDKLQIAGLAHPADETILLGEPASERFSACRLRDGVLVAVESVNSPGDHLAARRILRSGTQVTREDVHAPGFTLRSALAAPRPGSTDHRIPERTMS